MKQTATQMISGCGPGTAVPAGTPQEGVRGERVEAREYWARIYNAQYDLVQLRYTGDFAATARVYQQLADAYNALARMEGKG